MAIADLITQTADLVAQCNAAPSQDNLAALRDARNLMVESLLLSPPVLAEIEPSKWNAIQDGINQAGLKTSLDAEHELALLAAARNALHGGGDLLAVAILAHCLLTPPYMIPSLPAIQDIPRPWQELTIGALYAEPIFWIAAGEAERHLSFIERLTRSLVEMIEQQPAPTAESYELSRIATNSGRFINAYFADRSLRSLSEDRSRLTSYCFGAMSTPLDHCFAPVSRRRLKLGCFRLGWLSGTETAAMLAHLGSLDDRFEIILYASTPLADSPCEQAAQRLSSKVVVVDNVITRAAETIRADDLDIFLLGANITAGPNFPMGLAQFRLARFQVATTVCPSTTGLPLMDAFLNGVLNERPDAQADYSEKLLLAPGAINLYDFHEDAEADPEHFERAQLGLADSDFAFISGANTYKIGVELLTSWARILQQTENSKLLLYPFNPNWRALYPRQEFTRHVRKIMALNGIDPQRVILLPQQPSRGHIRSMLRLADLYLDSFPFSGAVSILDPVEAQLPILLHEGQQARCRQSTGMHAQFQLPAVVANSPQEYETLAVTLAHNPALLKSLRDAAPASLARVRAGRLQLSDTLYQAFAEHRQTAVAEPAAVVS